MAKKEKEKIIYVEPKAYFPPEIWKILDGEAADEKNKDKSEEKGKKAPKKTTTGHSSCERR